MTVKNLFHKVSLINFLLAQNDKQIFTSMLHVHDRVGILNFEIRCLNYELLNTEVFVDPRQCRQIP